MSVRQGLVCKLQREVDAFWFVTILLEILSLGRREQPLGTALGHLITKATEIVPCLLNL